MGCWEGNWRQKHRQGGRSSPSLQAPALAEGHGPQPLWPPLVPSGLQRSLACPTTLCGVLTPRPHVSNGSFIKFCSKHAIWHGDPDWSRGGRVDREVQYNAEQYNNIASQEVQELWGLVAWIVDPSRLHQPLSSSVSTSKNRINTRASVTGAAMQIK